MGRVNPAVFPVPVCAAAITSRPLITAGIACAWIGDGVVYSLSFRARSSGWLSPRLSKPLLVAVSAALLSAGVVREAGLDAVMIESR